MFRPTRSRAPRMRLALALLLCLAWAVGWAAASAQTFPPIEGITADDTGAVNAAAVNSAAQPLQQQGVKPLVVMLQNGTSDPESLAYSAAQQYGYGQDRQIDPDLFEILVTNNPRQYTILYGDNLAPVMEQARIGSKLSDRIALEALRPKLVDGDPTAAFVDSLKRAAREIEAYRNPPPPPTPVPSVVNNNNFDFSAIANALLWIFGVLALMAALAFIGPAAMRRYRKGQEAAERLRLLSEQLSQARDTAAGMITSLDFPADPSEQIQYRFLALALAQERPKQLADLTAEYGAVHTRLAEALSRFDEVSSKQHTTELELTAAVAEYQWVQGRVKEAQDFLQRLSELGKSVEGEVQSAPGEVDAAKKAVAAVSDATARLAAAAPDLQLPSAGELGATTAEQVHRAEQALAARPPMPLRAYEEARGAQNQAGLQLADLKRLEQAYAELVRRRSTLTDARRQGFSLTRVDVAFAGALSALSGAAGSWTADDAQAKEAAMLRAEAAIQRAGDAIGHTTALHADNAKALDKLKAAGEDLKRYIQEGARAFDEVDEYAPDTWQDIRGNGTEAQGRADRAFALWEQATQLNSVSPGAEQDFEGAAALIEQANSLIEEGRALITAILERLQNLQRSRSTARDEIAAADKSIAQGRAFIQRYDPDITPNPADMLEAAARQLEQAKVEIAQPKPDWIKVVQLARGANNTADKALADARSQEEAMEALRLKLQTARQQAEAGVSRALNFVSVHEGDVDRTAQGMSSEAQATLAAAQEVETRLQTGGAEDIERARLLDTATAAYAAARQKADGAYEQAFKQFQEIDSLRRDTAGVLQKAGNAVNQAAAYIRSNADVLDGGPERMLREAVALLPGRQDGADAATLRAMQGAAMKARTRAESAMKEASSQVQNYNEQARAREEANIGGLLGMFIGSAGDSAAGSSGGWWGSGGGSSSGGGHSWGGGGHSSGSWGGGGHSSGSFGGGGSSKGSWGSGGSSSGGW